MKLEKRRLLTATTCSGTELNATGQLRLPAIRWALCHAERNEKWKTHRPGNLCACNECVRRRRCVPVRLWMGCAAAVAAGTAYGGYEDGLRGITSLINTRWSINPAPLSGRRVHTHPRERSRLVCVRGRALKGCHGSIWVILDHWTRHADTYARACTEATRNTHTSTQTQTHAHTHAHTSTKTCMFTQLHTVLYTSLTHAQT